MLNYLLCYKRPDSGYTGVNKVANFVIPKNVPNTVLRAITS